MPTLFADPATTTAEDIAVFLDGLPEFSYPTPAAMTAEALADDLNSEIGLFPGSRVSVTPEDIADALNASHLTTITGTITVSLRAWRAW